MKRFLSSPAARLTLTAVALCLLLALFFKLIRTKEQSAGARLASQAEQQRRRTVAASEGLNQAAATASRLASEEAAELAQIRQWQKTRPAEQEPVKAAE